MLRVAGRLPGARRADWAGLLEHPLLSQQVAELHVIADEASLSHVLQDISRLNRLHLPVHGVNMALHVLRGSKANTPASKSIEHV